MAYEIGYRRPPASGRFKKGSSGNPKGRPRGSSNFLTLLDRELGQSIVVNENGKKKSITRMQAMVKRIVAGALQGDQRALLTLVEILRRTGALMKLKSATCYQRIMKTFWTPTSRNGKRQPEKAEKIRNER